MTPGQIITAMQVLAAIVVAGFAAHNYLFSIARAALALIVALAITRIFKSGLPPDMAFVAWSALWVAVGGWIARQGMASKDSKVAIAGGIAILSGFADAAAWYFSAAASLWSPIVMTADILVAMALAVLFWGAVGGGPNRNYQGKRHSLGVPGMVLIRGVQDNMEPDNLVTRKAGQ
jgi:hypothetical protein